MGVDIMFTVLHTDTLEHTTDTLNIPIGIHIYMYTYI